MARRVPVAVPAAGRPEGTADVGHAIHRGRDRAAGGCRDHPVPRRNHRVPGDRIVPRALRVAPGDQTPGRRRRGVGGVDGPHGAGVVDDSPHGCEIQWRLGPRGAAPRGAGDPWVRHWYAVAVSGRGHAVHHPRGPAGRRDPRVRPETCPFLTGPAGVWTERRRGVRARRLSGVSDRRSVDRELIFWVGGNRMDVSQAAVGQIRHGCRARHQEANNLSIARRQSDTMTG